MGYLMLRKTLSISYLQIVHYHITGDIPIVSWTISQRVLPQG